MFVIWVRSTMTFFVIVASPLPRPRGLRRWRCLSPSGAMPMICSSHRKLHFSDPGSPRLVRLKEVVEGAPVKADVGGRRGSSMVKPLHRNHTNTPTRCNAMMVQPSRDWSVFKQIFADHWDGFTHAHPRYQTAYYHDLVSKMLACGNPDKMGSIEYRCLHCGQGTHCVSMSCKSALCLRCAKVHVDNWVSQVSTMLHEGVIYRHIILTVPAMFRTTFYHNAAVLLSALMRCGVQCLDDFYSEVRGKGLKGGYIVV